MTRIQVTLSDDDFVKLVQMANQELRHPREQAAYLLRLALNAKDTKPDPRQAHTADPREAKPL